MSEYQYYEFRAIDRPLDRTQMDELRRAEADARIKQLRQKHAKKVSLIERFDKNGL